MKSAQEILQKVKRIELKTKWQTQQLFGGDYHSAFKGKGMSFSEVRDYQYGDDVRNIDWNVTARTNSPHIKIFEEERELNVVIIADMSASMYFGLTQQFKIETLIELSAAIAFSATNNQDKVGALLCTEGVEKYIAPKKGKQHMLKIITEMVRHEPSTLSCDLSKAIEYLYHVEKKRSIVFVISDFMNDGFLASLKVLNNKHDVIGIKIYDEIEKNLPACGLVRMRDIKNSGDLWVDTDDTSVRRHYADYFKYWDEKYKNAFAQAGAATLDISTDQDCFRALQTFFHNRARR